MKGKSRDDGREKKGKEDGQVEEGISNKRKKTKGSGSKVIRREKEREWKVRVGR